MTTQLLSHCVALVCAQGLSSCSVHVPLGISVYLSCLQHEAFCHRGRSEDALCICSTSLVVIERSVSL